MKFIILIIIAILLSGCVTSKKPEREMENKKVELRFSSPERGEQFLHQWAIKNQGTHKYPTQTEVDKWERIK